MPARAVALESGDSLFTWEYFAIRAVFLGGGVMRISFFTERAAQAAVEIWERHGLDAMRSGTVVVTDCPTLWAVPIINQAIGFDQVERFDVISPGAAAGDGKALHRQAAARPLLRKSELEMWGRGEQGH
jgi:hypothetical protein